MNLLVKRLAGREYIITDMMATSLSKAKFEKLKELNADKLGDWVFMPASEVDWTWWDRVFKKLTASKIVRTSFRYDMASGKVQEW